MPDDLSNSRVLAITSNYGVEQDELTVPVEHLRERGAKVDIAAPSLDPIQTLKSDRDLGREVSPTVALSQVDGGEYELLVVPGGTINADQLRLTGHAVDLVASFHSSARPVAAICHGPWLLVEADVVAGCSLTSYPSLRTDIHNAGGVWSDKPVVVDTSGASVKITSRNPGDLEHFTDAIVTQLENAG